MELHPVEGPWIGSEEAEPAEEPRAAKEVMAAEGPSPLKRPRWHMRPSPTAAKPDCGQGPAAAGALRVGCLLVLF